MPEELTLEDLPGVGRVTAEKLRRAGVYSVKQLALYTADELMELVPELSPQRLSKILREARNLLNLKVYTGDEYLRKVAERNKLTTGVKSIDNLLNGGLEPTALYEFAGEFGSGKTQLCHQLSVTAQLSTNRGGIGGKVFYIDTEGTFSPERIKNIAKRFEMDEDTVLKNIFTISVINVDHLIDVVRVDLVRAIEEDKVRLVIIDSLTSHFRAEYPGRENLSLRQQRLNYLINWLHRVARIYEIFVVATNQVVEIPAGFTLKKSKIPVGGNIVAHNMTHRFVLERSGDKYAIRVLDSPKLPRGAVAYFKITDEGVVDA